MPCSIPTGCSTLAKPARKSFAFITRRAPYGSNRPQLCLDAALAAAVFEQQVSYFFLDDGVYQLLDNQNAEAIQSKSLGNALETLELYGIEEVCVDAAALQARGLDKEDLVLPVTVCDREEIGRRLEQADCVFNL